MLGNDIDRIEALLWEKYMEMKEQWKKKWEGDYVRAVNTGWNLRKKGKTAWKNTPEIIREAMICERVRIMAQNTQSAGCVILEAQEELTAEKWEDQEIPHWIR